MAPCEPPPPPRAHCVGWEVSCVNHPYNTRGGTSVNKRVPEAESMQKSLLFGAPGRALERRWPLI